MFKSFFPFYILLFSLYLTVLRVSYSILWIFSYPVIGNKYLNNDRCVCFKQMNLQDNSFVFKYYFINQLKAVFISMLFCNSTITEIYGKINRSLWFSGQMQNFLQNRVSMSNSNLQVAVFLTFTILLPQSYPMSSNVCDQYKKSHNYGLK